MTDPIMQAYLQVEQAMQRYTEILEAQVLSLRASEASDSKVLDRMTLGARAMRDSSAIYLSYAKFIAYGMPESEELIQDDLQG